MSDRDWLRQRRLGTWVSSFKNSRYYKRCIGGETTIARWKRIQAAVKQTRSSHPELQGELLEERIDVARHTERASYKYDQMLEVIQELNGRTCYSWMQNDGLQKLSDQQRCMLHTIIQISSEDAQAIAESVKQKVLDERDMYVKRCKYTRAQFNRLEILMPSDTDSDSNSEYWEAEAEKYPEVKTAKDAWKQAELVLQEQSRANAEADRQRERAILVREKEHRQIELDRNEYKRTSRIPVVIRDPITKASECFSISRPFRFSELRDLAITFGGGGELAGEPARKDHTGWVQNDTQAMLYWRSTFDDQPIYDDVTLRNAVDTEHTSMSANLHLMWIPRGTAFEPGINPNKCTKQ